MPMPGRYQGEEGDERRYVKKYIGTLLIAGIRV